MLNFSMKLAPINYVEKLKRRKKLCYFDIKEKFITSSIIHKQQFPFIFLINIILMKIIKKKSYRQNYLEIQEVTNFKEISQFVTLGHSFMK